LVSSAERSSPELKTTYLPSALMAGSRDPKYSPSLPSVRTETRMVVPGWTA
jgi:hypothetical protein